MTQLYVLVAGPASKQDMWVKVGITKEGVIKRMHSLQTGCPFKITPICTLNLPEKDAKKIERGLHLKLRVFHENGEWFLFNEDSHKEIDQYFFEIMKSNSAAYYTEIRPANKGYEFKNHYNSIYFDDNYSGGIMSINTT